MHDIHEANRISQVIIEHLKKHNLKKLQSINIELGSIIEHGEDILPENLDFNLRLILKEYIDKNTKINIKKTRGDSWKLVSIEAD
jgi:Zn finger protein HypA/HybF involved in hydrogenase expression